MDMRSIPIMQGLGYPVVIDVTHALQLPGGLGHATGGNREYIPQLARAAVAAGTDAVFMEVHPCPDEAKCDASNTLALDKFEKLIIILADIRKMAPNI